MSLIMDRYRFEYRAEIVNPLMMAIQRGESACVVGITGIGVSNLLHFLRQPDIKLRYLPRDIAERTHFIALSGWPGAQPKDSIFEQMTAWTSLIAECRGIDVANEASAGATLFQALRIGLRLVCGGHNQRFVFMFDEFGCLIQHQTSDFFDELRILRDDNRARGNVVFVVCTHHLPQPTSRITSRIYPVHQSKFFELIRDHIYLLPPYGESDSQAMLDFLLKRLDDNVWIAAEVRERLLALSGGHPSLLRRLVQVTAPSFADAALTPSGILELDGIQDACEHIWLNLHIEEQNALRAIVRGEGTDSEIEGFMRRRGLLLDVSSLFSPLFHEYVKQHQS